MMIPILRLIIHAICLCVTCGVIGNDQNSNDFYNSCRTGDIESVRSYLEKGFSLSQRDAKGNTGIIIASGRGQNEVIKLLISHGANLEDYSSSGIFEGKTPLSWACSQGRVDTAALLIQEGANPHHPQRKGVFAGKTPLMWASSQGRTEVVKLLISAGADVDYTSPTGNFKGKSALMWASSQGRVDAVRVLLEAGASVNIVDNDGVSALMWAAGSEAAGDDRHKKGLLESANKGHVEVVKLLLKYKAQPDMRDKDGITALMFACYHGHLGAVKALINAGSNADFRSKEGKTALQLARASGHYEIARAIEIGPTFMTATLDELKEMTACGWLLSVLRAPLGSGILVYAPSDENQQNDSHHYDLKSSCNELQRHGLDYSMYDLLVILHGSSISEMLIHTGLHNTTYAAQIRGKMQLEVLYGKFRKQLITNTGYIPSVGDEKVCRSNQES